MHSFTSGAFHAWGLAARGGGGQHVQQQVSPCACAPLRAGVLPGAGVQPLQTESSAALEGILQTVIIDTT